MWALYNCFFFGKRLKAPPNTPPPPTGEPLPLAAAAPSVRHDPLAQGTGLGQGGAQGGAEPIRLYWSDTPSRGPHSILLLTCI